MGELLGQAVARKSDFTDGNGARSATLECSSPQVRRSPTRPSPVTWPAGRPASSTPAPLGATRPSVASPPSPVSGSSSWPGPARAPLRPAAPHSGGRATPLKEPRSPSPPPGREPASCRR